MYTKLKLADGTIKFAVHGVFGESAASYLDHIDIYSEEDLSEEENSQRLKKDIEEAGGEELFRMFDTEGEAAAYQQGIEDMDGWMGYFFTDSKTHLKLYGFQEAELIPNT